MGSLLSTFIQIAPTDVCLLNMVNIFANLKMDDGRCLVQSRLVTSL